MKKIVFSFVVFIVVLFIWQRFSVSLESQAKHSSHTVTQFKTGVAFSGADRIDETFSFTSSEGQKICVKDFYGHYSLFFFGYSSCPSFCPEIVEKMAIIAQSLPAPYSPVHKISQRKPSRQINFYFVSIDPEHDTPEQLKSFLSAYEGGITGLRGDLPETAHDFAEYFRLHIAHARGEDGHIAHSASLVMLDPTGKSCAIISNLEDTTQVVADLIAIEKHLRPAVTSHWQAFSQSPGAYL